VSPGDRAELHLTLVPPAPRRAAGAYRWINAGPEEHRFLRPLCQAAGAAGLRLWVERGVSPDTLTRTDFGGMVTATVPFAGGEVAVVWSDFRVNAGSFAHATARRFTAFLDHLDDSARERFPLIYVVNSAGLSLMEGRALFSDAFAMWPALLDYADRHPVFTCAVGKCLGLAPLLLGLGHYRVAVAGRTQINLTGPEVLSLFFGKRTDFEAGAAAERACERGDLVHELVPSVDEAFVRFRDLLAPARTRRVPPPDAPPPTERDPVGLLGSFLDAPPCEVVPGWCDSVRLFLGTRGGAPLGVFVNPPRRPNNLIGVRTLAKYAAGLDLFRALGVPIVSLLDSPGIDPRFDQSDANLMRKMLRVGEKIIRYPHGAMGVVTGRCFGGASTLGFPKVFGSVRAVALRGARMGTMHERIITRLLEGSPRLLAQWREVAGRQGPGLEDLLADGTLDAVVEPADLPAELDRFLACLGARRIAHVPRRARRDWPVVTGRGRPPLTHEA
jgi:acetyl-CoA carboxylase carboxyltransferase component